MTSSRNNVTFVGHEPCPNCRKLGRDKHGDNLARYSDGSATCFAKCGYWEPRTKMGSSIPQKSSEVKTSHDLFGRLEPAIPFQNYKWLLQYLTADEIAANFRWSPKTNRHVYVCGPYAEGRSLNPNETKVLSIGQKPKIIFGDVFNIGNLVLVEDVVSAIAVGRVWPTLPLFGSGLSQTMLDWIVDNRYVEQVFIWLDSDKRKEAMAMEKRFQYRGLPAACVFTDQDPKCYGEADVLTHLKRSAINAPGTLAVSP